LRVGGAPAADLARADAAFRLAPAATRTVAEWTLFTGDAAMAPLPRHAERPSRRLSSSRPAIGRR
jgi:hypothetical protein